MNTSRSPADPVDGLPVLGELFAVELANTRYHSDREDLDFLAEAEVLATWFGHAPAAQDLTVPEHLPPDSMAAVRRIRDATRLLLGEAVDKVRSAAGAEAAEVLCTEGRRAAAHLALDISGEGAPTWTVHYDGRPEDVFVAGVAGRCILFLGDDDVDKVRRCARPACPMLFVQRHRARVFCDESCSQSVRQARYYRSTVRPRRRRPPR